MTRLYKLNTNAFSSLSHNIEKNLELYQDPNTDFKQVLLSEGIQEYSESTDVIINGDIRLKPPDSKNQRHSHLADKQALDFYYSLEGMTPRLATDPHIWAYINHFYLHEYGILRWPKNGVIDVKVLDHKMPIQCQKDVHKKDNKLVANIEDHWLTPRRSNTKIYKSSISGRTWWLAHTALKAAESSNGAFTAEEAVELFSNYPEYYHRSMEYDVVQNPIILAECIRALHTDARGINRDGYIEILKDINREGGAKLLDSLDQPVIRRMIQNSADKHMRNPDFVPNRNNLKGVKKVKVLSLGAGTQSTVMALMAEKGVEGLEKPDFAIFADTHWEPPHVYKHLEWLEKQLSYEVIRVSAGNIRENILKGVTPDGYKFLDVPVFLVKSDGNTAVAARHSVSSEVIH